MYELKEVLKSSESIPLKITSPDKTIELEKVKKDRVDRIDSTGNLLWPSEELLSFILMKDEGLDLLGRVKGRY